MPGADGQTDCLTDAAHAPWPCLSVAGCCLAHMPDSTTCLFPDDRGWGRGEEDQIPKGGNVDCVSACMPGNDFPRDEKVKEEK